MIKNDIWRVMYKIMVFALPICAGGMVNTIAGFISMSMVAQVSKDQLAAGSLAITTFMTIMTVTTTIFYSIGILISHARSKVSKSNSDQQLISSDHTSEHKVGLIIKNGMWLALFFAIPSGLMLWYADHLLLFFKQDRQLVIYARDYFHIIAFNMVTILLLAVISQFFAGLGKPKITLYISLTSFPFIMVCSYALILGRFGLPAMGLSGIACASLIVQTFVVVFVLIMMYFNHDFKKYQIFTRPFTIDKVICKSIISLGIPVGIQFGGEFIAISVSTYMMGYFGVTALAASQVAGQFFMVIIVIVIGMTQALSILVSEAYGKKNYDLIHEYIRASILLLAFIAVIIGIFFIVYPAELIHAYVGNHYFNAQFEHLAIIFLAVNAILFFVDGLRHLFAGSLRGLHDTHTPMRIGIISLWLVSLPISFLTGFVLDGGPVGLRAGFLSGFLVAAICLATRIRKKLYEINRLDLCLSSP